MVKYRIYCVDNRRVWAEPQEMDRGRAFQGNSTNFSRYGPGGGGGSFETPGRGVALRGPPQGGAPKKSCVHWYKNPRGCKMGDACTFAHIGPEGQGLAKNNKRPGDSGIGGRGAIDRGDPKRSRMF